MRKIILFFKSNPGALILLLMFVLGIIFGVLFGAYMK